MKFDILRIFATSDEIGALRKRITYMEAWQLKLIF